MGGSVPVQLRSVWRRRAGCQIKGDESVPSGRCAAAADAADADAGSGTRDWVHGPVCSVPRAGSVHACPADAANAAIARTADAADADAADAGTTSAICAEEGAQGISSVTVRPLRADSTECLAMHVGIISRHVTMHVLYTAVPYCIYVMCLHTR